MQRVLLVLALVAFAAPAGAGNVSVGVSIGAPGYYGQIEVGGYPPPALIYPQPVIVQPAPPGVVVQPIYLRVPADQANHWSKHCGRYHACGRPVYFVQDTWYRDVYAPHYNDGHGHGHHHHDDD